MESTFVALTTRRTANRVSKKQTAPERFWFGAVDLPAVRLDFQKTAQTAE